MRIAIMLRAYDRPGGIGIYARNIVKNLLEIDRSNEYFLLHNNPAHIGRYSQLPNVTEKCIPAANPVLWDQWFVPRYLHDKQIDVLLNTKFSVPFLGAYKKIMVLHGASWHVHPELYGSFDVFYTKLALPRYCRKADFLISNSDLTTGDYLRIFDIPESKIRTINLAAGDEFKRETRESELERIKKRYHLPDDFILTVTSYDPRKNFGTLADAFEKVRKQTDIKLVVVGKDCDKYVPDFDLDKRGLSQHMIFPGWIEQGDLPGIYSLASVFAFPSVYEEFGIPVVEAISTGCPVVSSTTGAIPHLLGDAALLCDPFDTATLAANLLRVLNEESLREDIVSKGLARAGDFSWETAARQTLEVMNDVCSD